jgi:N-glycosylase/DNA lyase
MNNSSLLKEYQERKHIIQSRLKDFSSIKEEEYFYELCFCLLTPQTSAKLADETIQKLKKNNFQNKDFNPVKYLNKIRFLNNKSKYLLELKRNYKMIYKNILNLKDNPIELREYLIKNIKGINYKESAHFIRNIGLSNNKITILDRHILKNLNSLNIIKEIPKTLSKNKYLKNRI